MYTKTYEKTQEKPYEDWSDYGEAWFYQPTEEKTNERREIKGIDQVAMASESDDCLNLKSLVLEPTFA